MAGLQEFNYGPQDYAELYKDATKNPVDWDVDDIASFTNVALVNITGDDVTLAGAASVKLDKLAQPVATADKAFAYATDYIQLSIDDIAKGAVRYPIYGDTTPGSYADLNNTYVNAVHDTQYYIAYNGGVYSFTDYVNFPGLDKDDNQIHAAYAVARNTNSDKADKPYWVADVIVYEIYAELDSIDQTSVSLAYQLNYKQGGQVVNVDTLNSKYGNVLLQPTDLGWWDGLDGLGFYALYNETEAVDGTMTARTIKKLEIGDYTKNGVHAGTITREAYISDNGMYIDLNLDGIGATVSIEVTRDNIWNIKPANNSTGTTYPNYNSGSYNTNNAWELEYERVSTSNVRKGDRVIWVGGAATNGTKSTANFIVDLGSEIVWKDSNVTSGEDLLLGTSSFLIDLVRDADGKIVRDVNGQVQISSFMTATNSSGIYQQIVKEQWNSVNGTWDVNVIKYQLADGTPVTAEDGAPTFVGPKTIAITNKDSHVLNFANTAEYVVDKVTVVSTDKDGKYTANVRLNTATNPNTWVLYNITDDVDLVVVVKPATYGVIMNTTDETRNVVAVTDQDNTAIGLTSVATQVNGGTLLTLTITPDTANGYQNSTYVVTVDGTPKAATIVNGKNVYEILVDHDNIVINVSATVYEVSLNQTPAGSVTNATINGAAVTLTNVAKKIPAGNLILSLNHANGYSQYTVNNGTNTSTVTAATTTINVDRNRNITVAGVTRNVTLTVDTPNMAGATVTVDAPYASLGTTAVAIPVGTNLVLTLGSKNAGTTYTVKAGTTEIREAAGKYTIPVDPGANTLAITVTGKTANATGELTALTVTKATNPATTATVNVTGSSDTVNSFPFGQTTTTATLTVSKDATVKVWRGPAILENEVSTTKTAGATSDTYTCTLTVGENGAALSYVIEVFAEANDTDTADDTFTLTLEAVAASSNVEIQPTTAAAGLIGVTYTAAVAGPPAVDASGNVKIIDTMRGSITVSQLLSYLEAKTGEFVAGITVVDADGNTVAGTATVTTTMKVKVVAENEDVLNYVITFNASV